jgi:glucose uptake protein
MGGIIFNAANILIGAAIAVAGMSVAFPVGIGIALLLGVIVNYLANPVGDATFLFGGVLLILLAIVLNAFAYKRMTKLSGKMSAKGLVLSVLGGVLMGFFYRYVADSMFLDFSNPEPEKLSPYTAVFIFSIGILVSNFLFNSLMMRWSFTGERVKISEYFKGKTSNHLFGILGGAIWCTGMSFSIIAADKAGPAISYGLGQGATLVAALWGVFIWKEFKNAPQSVSRLIYYMFPAFLFGLVAIILAH